MNNHLSPISGITSTENYIASAGYDNQVILWSKKNKEFINRGWHDHLVNYVAFSPNGKLLLSTSSDYSARLWSLPEMKLSVVFGCHDDDVESASFSNCGEFVATASRDYKIRIFSINGDLIKILSGHTADALSVVWANNDSELVSSGDDGTIRIWDVTNGKIKMSIHFDDIETDTCSVYNNWIFAGNDNGEINLIDGKAGKLLNTLPAHSAGIKSLKVNQKLKMLVSSSYDRTVKLWHIDNTTGELLCSREVMCPPLIWLRAICIVDDHTLAFGTFGTCYATYDIESENWDFKDVKNTHGKNAVLAVGKDIYDVGDSGEVYLNGEPCAKMGSLCNFLLQVEDVIVTGGQTGEIFNAKTGTVFHQHHSPINCGAIYKVDQTTYAVIGTYTGEGLIFKYSKGTLNHHNTIKLHSNAIKGLASNGNIIFSVCADTSATFYDALNLTTLHTKKNAHGLIANGADWLSNSTFVSISRDRKIRIWHSPDHCEEIDSPHTHSIKCVKVAATNRNLIATGAYNGLFSAFDLKTKTWIFTKKISSSGISSISFSIVNNCFLASSYDGHIYHINLSL